MVLEPQKLPGFGFSLKDKDQVNLIISKEKLQYGLKNYSTKITT